MEKSEKAKQLRALRKYGKKVRKKEHLRGPGRAGCARADCAGVPGKVSAGVPEHRFTRHRGTPGCIQHSVVAVAELQSLE
jgi:hypothetical protein